MDLQPSGIVSRLPAHAGKPVERHAGKPVRAAQKPDATADFDGADDLNVEADDLSFLAPPQAPDEIGRLGPYRVLKVIGSGGMGIVFQAEDVSLYSGASP